MMVMGVISASESNGMCLDTLGLTTWLLDNTPITEPSQNLLAAFLQPQKGGEQVHTHARFAWCR